MGKAHRSRATQPQCRSAVFARDGPRKSLLNVFDDPDSGRTSELQATYFM